MLESMTGFGKASGTYGDKKIIVEIKSLNSKQFDLSMKMPSLYREKELTLRSFLSERLGRGKTDLSIFTESPEGEKKVNLNQNLASLYLQQIRAIEEKTGLKPTENAIGILLGLPDVLQPERARLEEEEWKAVQKVVDEATERLLDFRRDEGRRLAEDIEQRVENIRQLRTSVEGHLADRLQAVRGRIEKNIRDFVSDDVGDKNRLEQEIVYYMEKLDITEENIRLEGHCNYFLDTMRGEEEGAGKKLGFISQEIGREINTMGSKANYILIQKPVVQMKDELEKIKEQLLNIR